MTKKVIFKYSVVTVMVVLMIALIVFFNPFKEKKCKIEMQTTSDVSVGDAYQLFYLLNSDAADAQYTEEKALYVDILPGKLNEISFELPAGTRSFRLDFGMNQGTIIIESMSIGTTKSKIDFIQEGYEKLAYQSGIENISTKDDKMYIDSVSTDPFLVWNFDDLSVKETINEELRVNNIYAKVAACIGVLLLLFFFLKNFEELVEFPVQIFHSHKLIGQLAKNDFKTKYAGSYLGIVWAFIQPVITVFVYWFVFGVGLRSGKVLDVPFVLWLIAGLVPWFFFSDGWSGGTGALIEYQYLVKKVVFQIDILPIVKVLSAVFVHAFFVLFTIVLYACYGYSPDWHMLQLVYYSFCVFVLVLGLSYITSAIVGFFRDLSQIISIIMQVGIWMTPIMWNMDGMNLPSWITTILKLNPMYYVVAGYRDALINKVWFWEKGALTLYFWGITLLILGAGALVFKKLKIHFADVL